MTKKAAAYFLLLLIGWSLEAVVAQPLEIGAILQLSGKEAEYGEKALRGAEVAAEIINAQKLLGERKLKIVLEDGKGVPADSLAALRRFTTLRRIPAFITQSSAVSVSLAPVSNAEKVLQMDVGSTTPAYRRKGGFTFRTAVTSLQLAKGLAEAMSRLKVQRCALLYQEDDYGNGFQEVFRSRYSALGGEVALAEAFMLSETNFRSQLMRFKAIAIPAIVLSARYSISGTLLKQARETGITAAFFGDAYVIESDEVLRTAGAAVEGFTYVAPRFSADGTEVAGRFAQRFRLKYGVSPVQHSAQAHDGVWAIALAAKECPGLDRECLRSKMRNLSFEGASGSIQFDEYGDVRERATLLKTVKDGQFVTLE